MTEWLALLLLAAAIVVPAVLLLGFAGCYSSPPLVTPIIKFVRGATLTSIEVDWTLVGPHINWIVEVTKAGDAPFELPSPAPPLEIPNLETGAAYTIRVKVSIGDDGESDYSAPVTGSTLAAAFDFPFTPGLAGDAANVEGLCFIDRIEAPRLTRSGPRVALTVVGPSAGTTSIDRIYVSQPAAAGDPYDAAGDLTAIFDVNTPPGFAPIVLQPNEVRTLPLVDYALDEQQPLLVAFDITSSPPAGPSTIRFLPVQPQDASSFTRRTVEAAVADRTTGFSIDGRLWLVTRIDV